MAECSFETEEDYQLLDDEDDVEDVLDTFMGIDNVLPTVDNDCTDAIAIDHSAKETPKQAVSTARKNARSVPKPVPVEKDVATVKVSARSLALAQANQDIKTTVQKELLQQKMDSFAKIQADKALAKMDQLATAHANKSIRRQQAFEDKDRQDSMKRRKEFTDCYMKLGLSPMSASKKAKLAEKELQDD